MNNEFKWVKYKGNPVFPSVKGTWMEAQTANPDLLLIGDTYHMYFRAQQGGHDRIGVATVHKDKFDGVTWNIHPKALLSEGKPGDWDENHLLDPASVYVDGKVYIYYSAVSNKCHRSICMATSDDGINFVKYHANPVVIGGGPEIVYKNGTFYLFFWKDVPGSTGFQLHLAVSKDGFNFKEYMDKPILPIGPKGAWDSYTVETPRIFKEGNLYYMLYCGSDKFSDYPANAGVAYSSDLVTWKKYDRNPVFSRGDEGDWDEGAIWFTTVEKVNGKYYLWYEGYGGGEARNKEYGSYLQGGKSQIGMAVMEADYFYVK